MSRRERERKWIGPAGAFEGDDAGTPGSFIIRRAEAGYDWQGDRLIPKTGANGEARLAPYTPPKDLLFILARLAADRDAIRGFANRFGALGLRYRRIRGPQPGYVELLSEWREEIDRLKQALTIWKAVHDGDQETLRTLIKWDRKGDAVVYDTHADTPFGMMSEGTRRTSAIIASRRIHPELLSAMAPGDAVAPARAYLTRLVNENAIDLVRPQLRMDRELERIEWGCVAYGVAGCAWLQLAEAINDGATYRRCANPRCGTWFIVSREHPQGKRPTRRTCSNACRVKIMYLRELEAAKLRRDGLPAKAIAQRLEADVESVKRWIEKRGPRRSQKR